MVCVSNIYLRRLSCHYLQFSSYPHSSFMCQTWILGDGIMWRKPNPGAPSATQQLNGTYILLLNIPPQVTLEIIGSASGLTNPSFWSRQQQVIPGLLAENALPAALHLGQHLRDVCAHRIMVMVLSSQQLCLFPGSESGFSIVFWRNWFQSPVAVGLAWWSRWHRTKEMWLVGSKGSWWIKLGFSCFARGSSYDDFAGFYCS